MKLDSKDRNIWFTSDTHFGHKNIVRGVTDWEDKNGCRDFDTIEKMNEIIVEGINKNVQQDDILFHLGDWSFGGIGNISKFRSRLNVEEIHLVLGNHDQHVKNDKVITSIDRDLNIHAKDLFNSVTNYLEVSIDKQLINLSHYPIISWNASYRGSWMLHGHSHDTLINPAYRQWGGSDYFYTSAKILDVGVDTAFRLLEEYRPFKFEEIKKIMNKRKILRIDHHDKKTNG